MIRNRATAFVRGFEGLHDGDRRTPLLEPARDPVGIWTLGWGAVFDGAGRRVTADSQPITHTQADALLARDVERAVRVAIDLCRPRVLGPGQAVALGDFIYNLGAAAFRGSTLRRLVVEGRDGEVPAALARWRFAAGQALPGLARRRAAEARLYLAG